MTKQDIFCVIGPTAIGKSDYAISLAQELNAEIISADAYQVYRYMNIGTAKISDEDKTKAPHHLIDILDPDEAYNVQDFLKRCDDIIANCRHNQKPIIICGGTGLFVRAFLYQYELPPVQSDPTLRNELMTRYDTEGAQALWDELHAIDPDSVKSTHPNNKHHVVRALELYYLTKQKPSTIKQQAGLRKDVTIIGLTGDREGVIERINARVDAMIDAGLVAEVQSLLDKGYSTDLQAFKSIGYKEVIQYINGDITYDEMIDLIKVNTRRFSKQQMTWFKKIENVKWKTIL